MLLSLTIISFFVTSSFNVCSNSSDFFQQIFPAKEEKLGKGRVNFKFEHGEYCDRSFPFQEKSQQPFLLTYLCPH